MASFFQKLLSRRRAMEDALQDEIRFHLEEEAEQLQAQGLTAEEAKWAARREIAKLLLTRRSRNQTGKAMMPGWASSY
jgi:hypothetical protein